MNADRRWENQARTLIRYTFSGSWNWDDFYNAFDPCEAHSPDQQICVLIDLRQVARIPSDAVLHLKPAANRAAETSGVIVVIATSIPAVTLFKLFLTLYKPVSAKFRFATSDDEAYAILGLPHQRHIPLTPDSSPTQAERGEKTTDRQENKPSS